MCAQAVTLGANYGLSPAVRLKECQGCSAAFFRDNPPASPPVFVIGSLSGRFQHRDGSIGEGAPQLAFKRAGEIDKLSSKQQPERKNKCLAPLKHLTLS